MSKSRTLKTKFLGFLKNYFRVRIGIAGLFIIIVLSLVAILAPVISPFNPKSVDMDVRLTGPGALQNYPLGTDQFGRDMLSRLIYGTQVSLLVGFTAAGICTLIGLILGSFAGYYGGRVDDLIMRITDIFLALPGFFLILMVVAVFGPSLSLIILVIGVTVWPSTARLIRAEFLAIREREFVSAAKLSGASNKKIIFVEILPNAIHPIIINSTLLIAGSILMEASLSFLGMGDPNSISWGGMLNDSLVYFRQAWWIAVLPGLAISITSIAFNLVGDALNDALNPRLRVL